ncbi:hypothetical protein D2W70_21640 [Burkholderia pseudomallei]|nr:hypothetical protein D2W70_21640 [Burkholderia pseudomallei]RIV63821.1 hypothetical protein D2W49_08815 [Burkholderia pseudomallei]
MLIRVWGLLAGDDVARNVENVVDAIVVAVAGQIPHRPVRARCRLLGQGRSLMAAPYTDPCELSSECVLYCP